MFAHIAQLQAYCNPDNSGNVASSSVSGCLHQLDAVRLTADRQVVVAVAAAGKEVVMADGASGGQLESRTAGYELAVPGGGGAGGRKVLGSRDFALFYR
jgi:hypothetical protein